MARVTLPGHDQSTYRLRMEWGPTGAEAVPADFAVVVDVLSFTTTLSVALERGIEAAFELEDSELTAELLPPDDGPRRRMLFTEAAEGVVLLDTSDLGFDESVEAVLDVVAAETAE